MIVREEYALGRNGEIQEIIPKEEFIRRFPNEHLEIKPEESITEIFRTGKFAFAKENASGAFEECIARVYKAWGKFGPYGDVVSIRHPLVYGDDPVVTILGRRAFLKPALAVDCVIFVRDEAGNYFFVGIERSKEPGKGKAALVGGFIDVDGYAMETTLQATLREVLEEVGVIILADQTPRQDFISHEVPIVAVLANSKKDFCATMLYYVGDIVTGDEEKLEHLKTRRVHRTFVYTCLIDLPGTQTAETVHGYFKAGSDAAKLAIIPFSPDDRKSVAAATEGFGVSHHKKMFSKAVAVVMK